MRSEGEREAGLALSVGAEGSKKRDPELEAKGASLSGTVATLLSPPFFGLQEGFGKQYLRCLSFISDLAQLQGLEVESSRLVALKALEAAARSDILYQTANDFELQIEYIAPALVANCYPTPPQDLKNLFNASDAETGTSRLSPSLSNRKPPSISSPSSPPSQHDLASIAVPTLRFIARLSDSSQLISLHTSISTFLNRHRSGELWHGNSQPFVEWLASSLLSASAPSYRPGVLQWWVDQVREINDTEASHKSVTLLYVLATLLRGKTHLHGLGVGGVLNTLGELLIRRAKSSYSSPNRSKPPPSPTNPNSRSTPATTSGGPPTDQAFSTERHDVDVERDQELLTRPILSTISAFASKIYYADQLDDLVSDVVDLVKSLRLEEGGGDEKVTAATKLVVAMRLLLEEAHRSEGTVEGSSRNEPERPKILEERRKEVSEMTVRQNGTTASPDRSYLPPPVTTTNGLNLGATASSSAHGEDDVFTVRGKKDLPSSQRDSRPSIVVGDRQNPTPASTGQRNRVSSRTFEKSLFLLTVGDSILRSEYVRAIVVYLETELDYKSLECRSTLPPELSSFWRSLHSTCFHLATSPNLSSPASSSSSSRPTTADQSHPLARVRSQCSLRGMSVDSTNSSRPPTINTSFHSSSPSGPAAPFDYSSIRFLLEACHRLGSTTALLEGVPMLLALDREAEEWCRGGGGREASTERMQATREIVAGTMREVGKKWRVREVERIGRDAIDSIKPSVLPAFGIPHHAQTSLASRSTLRPGSTILDAQAVVDALAFSDALQVAIELDRTSLAALMGANWTPQLASRTRSSSFASPYSNGGVNGPSRSILQLPLGSSTRLVSNASTHTATTSPPSRGPGSMCTPSLADLQSSLGGGSGGGSPSLGLRSARQSQTPSLSSMRGEGTGSSSMFTMGSSTTTNGGSEASPSKRRTKKTSPEVLLASIGGGGKRGRAGTNTSSLSVQL
ncbi:uncharacterized protein JCM6883_001685 [Sporobolomyces salmoneus]|uniref:uncharacterized protein n=1 Tax=Sporobolomyces salmoneus TaxID=183962 RepID=UPI00317A27AA